MYGPTAMNETTTTAGTATKMNENTNQQLPPPTANPVITTTTATTATTTTLQPMMNSVKSEEVINQLTVPQSSSSNVQLVSGRRSPLFELLDVYDTSRCVIPNITMCRHSRHRAYSPASMESIKRCEQMHNLKNCAKYGQDGIYLLAVHLFLVSPQGNLLMQQRSNDIDYAGMWDCGVTGHVRCRETSLQALKRELEEELGLRDDELWSRIEQEPPIQITYGKYHINVYVVVWNGVEHFVREQHACDASCFSTSVCRDVQCIKLMHWREYKRMIEERHPAYYYADLQESGYHWVFQEIERKLSEVNSQAQVNMMQSQQQVDGQQQGVQGSKSTEADIGRATVFSQPQIQIVPPR